MAWNISIVDFLVGFDENRVGSNTHSIGKIESLKHSDETSNKCLGQTKTTIIG